MRFQVFTELLSHHISFDLVKGDVVGEDKDGEGDQR